MEIKENREDREDKEEYYMGTRMAIGCGLAHMPDTTTPRRLRSRQRLQTDKNKKTDNSKVIRFWRCVGDSNGYRHRADTLAKKRRAKPEQ